MTSFFERQVTCRVCRGASDQTIILSTNSYGSPDLDTRPPGMARSTMNQWVQECPTCGLCDENLAEGPAIARELLTGGAYQRIRQDADMPVLARQFLCAGWLAEQAGRWADASWDALHAAWACDDAGLVVAASRCRHIVHRRGVEAGSRGQALGRSVGATETILTDVLRRAGRFEEAQSFLALGLGRRPTTLIRQVLAFERRLLDRQDQGRYTVEQAVAAL